jgi:hypothetical protein
MTNEQFDQVVEWFQNDWQANTLVSKGKEYTADGDRLSNFKEIAWLTGLRPAQVAVVLKLKGEISFIKKVFSNKPMTEEFVNEKLGDEYNYIPLIKALLIDENLIINKEKSNDETIGSTIQGFNLYNAGMANSKSGTGTTGSR